MKTNPLLKSLISYLKEDFSQLQDWEVSTPKIKTTIPYETVKHELRGLLINDPKLYNTYRQLWISRRTRKEISLGLFIDSTTLKRKWDIASCYLLNRIFNDYNKAYLEPIDFSMNNEYRIYLSQDLNINSIYDIPMYNINTIC